MFIDLLKACDSLKHKVMSLAIKKMGAPEKCANWVEKSHRDFEVVLIIGREEISLNTVLKLDRVTI